MLRLLLLGALLAGTAAGDELFNDRVAYFDPFPREIDRGETLTVTGQLKGGFETPELVIIAPNGKTYLNEDNAIVHPRFTFTVRFEEGVGRYRLEVLARRPNALRSAARFSVWHGLRKPAKVERATKPVDGPATPPWIHARLCEKRFFRLANEFRASIELEALGWNEAVAARARAHAARMARAARRQHKFGTVGVKEMLAKDGAGGGMSGPATPWTRLVSNRPFPEPRPQPPGPRVRNYVVVFLASTRPAQKGDPPGADSLQAMFENHFVSEAAHRICLADPHCVEIGVGAARPAKKGTTGQVYYCVCFVQINHETLIEGQEQAYRRCYKAAKTQDRDALRWLGIWGRDKAIPMLRRMQRSRDPVIASAAFDGWLLLEEEGPREQFARAQERASRALERRRYGDAAAVYEPFLDVRYDRSIPRACERAIHEADKRARREMRDAMTLPDKERLKALRNLRSRARGLPVAEFVQSMIRKLAASK